MGRKVERIWPRWVQSVGAMRDNAVQVKAICDTCGTAFRVDLGTLCTMRGRSYSLIGKRAPCKVYGCEGSCVFLYSSGAGTPFQPLA